MRSSTMLRAAVALLLAHAALAAARPASATAVDEPSTRLRFEVAPAGAAVCRVLPHESPDAPGCVGLDVLAMEQKLSATAEQASAVVVIRFDDWGMILTVKGQPGFELRSAEHIEGFLRGVHQGIAGTAPGPAEPMHGDTPGTRYDLLKRNGVDVVRTTTAFAAPPGSPTEGANHMRIYLPVSRTGLAMLTFAGPPERAAALAEVAEGVVGTLSMADAGVEDFGEPKAYFAGKLVGTALGALLPIVAIAVAAFVAWRRSKAQPSGRPREGAAPPR